MKQLNIDIETYSSADLFKVGVYKYVDVPDFAILLFAYSVDHGPVECLDLTVEELPTPIVNALLDNEVVKVAFNAQFERVCLGKYLGTTLNPAAWRCTMVWANELGLPSSLAQCAKYLGIEEQKDTRGKALINYFSKPCKPTKVNGGRTRNLPEHDTEKWETFIEYCVQDVKTEMAIADRLAKVPVPDSEWAIYAADQEINDRGVAVDLDLAHEAVAMTDKLAEENLLKLHELTGLENPNSVQQIKLWLAERGLHIESLSKAVVSELIADDTLADDVREVLRLRQALSNSSTKKYVMMTNATCDDGRIRGILQFYGANRTGRWAGRLLQVQNLPRNYLDDLEFARDLVKAGDADGIELMFGDVPDTLKQLIRTALIPKQGYHFLVSDFSAIEARVIAWYAKQEWVLDVFRTHGKIYEATAAQMFGLGEVEEYDWKSHEGKDMRQRGKVATLALGYQGGTGALIAMGALKQGIPEEDLPDIVQKWRKANARIVNLWRTVQSCVIQALSEGGVVTGPRGLKFYKKYGFLFIQLPSGRRLSYAKAHLEEGEYGPAIYYEGQGDRVVFTKQQTYGGKLVENIVQATARDILAASILRISDKYPVVFHVHDEVICEVPQERGDINELNELLAITPDWCGDLPLKAAGFETKFYMKD